MEINTYFFDTYAFFELIKGNPNYKAYSKGIVVITTKLNLMELYYGLMLKHGKHVTENYYNALSEFSVDITDDIIKKAAEFRSINTGKNISYVDCIGYIISLKNNIKFLTGDDAFKDFPNVEFVK